MADIRKPLNVFSQSAVLGQIAEISAAGPETQTVQMLQGSTNVVTPGLPVKLVTGPGSVPLVDLAVPGTDDIYGLAIFNPKYNSYTGNDLLQVTCQHTVMFLVASGALARGAQVGLNTSTYQLIAATKANYIGQLLDVASAQGDIVRVELAIPLGVSKASA